jgi:hypothetical protein
MFMTDDSDSRFVVRKGTFKGRWMVWDRTIRGPAVIPDYGLAIDLSEQQAREIRDQLILDHGGGRGPAPPPRRGPLDLG